MPRRKKSKAEILAEKLDVIRSILDTSVIDSDEWDILLQNFHPYFRSNQNLSPAERRVLDGLIQVFTELDERSVELPKFGAIKK